MAGISVYIKTIAFFMIFSAFVEIVAPSGAFKKYIRLILSLVLIALVLEPLAIIIGGTGTGGVGRLRNAFEGGLLNAEASERERRLYEARGVSFSVEEYKKALNETTVQVILTETGFRTVSADVAVNENPDSDGFLTILGVHATVLAANSENEDDSGVIQRALLGGMSDLSDRDKLKQAASEKIKKSLSHFYNIETDNIHITVQDE